MLLERGALLGELGQRLDEAVQRSGSLVLLAGEAGVGKTSLVRPFADSLYGSAQVVEGACDPLTTPRPLSPLHDFAADPDFEFADPGRGDRAVIETFTELLGRLKNPVRPIVMVIEDIHWADGGTLDFVRFVGRRVMACRAVVVCTYRDDEVGPDHPLRPVLGQLLPLRSTYRMVVPPLTIDGVTSLAEGTTIEPAELFELTDGNPFFVTEILASGSDLPATVQEAVLARVARLSVTARRIVEAVSVAPRSLEITHAATIAGASLDDVDAALDAGVVVGDRLGLRFRHELARSAVEESMPIARRLGFHLHMLRILEQDADPDVARLAHHAVRAAATALIVEYAPRAARLAASEGSHKQAVSFFEAALAHADRIDDDDEAELRLDLADELGTVDRRLDALGQLDLAAQHYRAIGDELALAETLVPHTGARWRFEDASRFRIGLREALDILEPKGRTTQLARAYLSSAYGHMLARRGSDASSDLADARRTVEAAGADELDWMIRLLEGTVDVVTGTVDAGVRMLEELSHEAVAGGRVGDEVLALMMLGSGGGEARRYDVALPALERGVEHGLEVDQDYLVSYCRAWLARIALEQGRWEDAARSAGLVDHAAFSRTGIGVLTGLSALGRVRVRRGDPGGLALLEEMVELGRSHELQHGWNAVCGRAEHYWLAGRPADGLGEVANTYQRALETESAWARGEVAFWMWRLGAIDGPPEGAAEPFALHMSGASDEASAAWRDLGCPYEEAVALADGPVDARLEALDIFDTLGARPMADRVRGQLRNAGVDSIPRGPTRTTRDNPAGLTSRQLEVLQLLADGLTNGEIADRRFVSNKTVEHHVSAAYMKLGVTSRSRAVREAERIGAVGISR